MSDGTKKQSVPRLIEPRKFAHQGISLTGFIPGKEMTRLAEVASVEEVGVDLCFSLGEQRERILTGSVDLQAHMQCQRCLKNVDLAIECNVSLAVVRDEDQAKELSTCYDPWIVEEEEADLYAIIEEEILLNVPLVALHDTECSNEASLLTQTSDAETAEDADETNPFQVLLKLKDKTKETP